jgi:hypothetical protein
VVLVRERMIATSRLKAFFEQWLEENWEDDNLNNIGKRGVGVLAFRAKIDQRRINLVLNEETPNITFDFVDRVFVNLDCVHLWHMPPELGGFSDYYQDEIPERVPESPTQTRIRVVNNAKKQSLRSDRTWLDVLHEKALEEENALEEVAA